MTRPAFFPPVVARVRPERSDGQTRRKQFSEEQRIGIPNEAEAGAVVTELCRKHGMSCATYYAWKGKFGGLEVSDVKRLRALEDLLFERRIDLCHEAVRHRTGSGRCSPATSAASG